MEEKESLLRVENLRQYFNRGTFHALDGVSFEIKKGEVFSIVGESGCGKTTTGRAII
ncbi:MAG: ATP-binding cassette domain-containing protein, partial [Treponema sp.]|nr:ATP-binding cassette domain-containing protein [Treponema sp.]